MALLLLSALLLQEPPVRPEDQLLRAANDGSIRTYGRGLVKAETPDDLSSVTDYLKGRRWDRLHLRVEADVPWARIARLLKMAENAGHHLFWLAPADRPEEGVYLQAPKDRGILAPGPTVVLALGGAGTVRMDGKEIGSLDEAVKGLGDGILPVLEFDPKTSFKTALAVIRKLLKKLHGFMLPAEGGKTLPIFAGPGELSSLPEPHDRDLTVSIPKDGAGTSAEKVAALLAERAKKDDFRTHDGHGGFRANYRLFAVADPDAPYAALESVLESAAKSGVTTVVFSLDAGREEGALLSPVLDPAAMKVLGEVRLEIKGPGDLRPTVERLRDRSEELRAGKTDGWVRLKIDAPGATVRDLYRVMVLMTHEGLDGFETASGRPTGLLTLTEKQP